MSKEPKETKKKYLVYCEKRKEVIEIIKKKQVEILQLKNTINETFTKGI